MGQPQYLDDNGNPVGAPSGKVYLDDTGNPVAPKSTGGMPEILANLKRTINTPAGGSNYQAFQKTGPLDTAIGVGKKLAGIPAAIGNSFSGVGGMGQTIADLSQASTAGVMATPKDASFPERAAMAVGPLAGIDSAALAKSARNRDVGGMLVEGAVPVALASLPELSRRIDAARSARIPSPAETPSRSVALSIGPAPAEMNSLEANIGKHMGNILQYAQENKLPINGRMDLVNAAKAYAESQKSFYEQQVLAPLSDQQVTAPGGFSGRTIGEGGTRTTIGDLEGRLRQINTEQSSIYSAKKTNAATAEALAKDAQLTQEAASIRNVLYGEISKRTSLTAEQVGQLRESFGGPRGIADITKEALNNEALTGVRQSRSGGASVPTTAPGVLDRVYTNIRGGAVKIGDRQFGEALGGADFAPNNLPGDVQFNSPQPKPRIPVWSGMDTSGQPVGISRYVADADLPARVADRAARNNGRNMVYRSMEDMLRETQTNRTAARQMMARLKNKP